MQARIKSLVLPEAPHYEGNTGKPLDSEIEVLYAQDGSVLRAQRVSVQGLVLPSWHHDAKKGPGRPRKSGRPHTGGRGTPLTESEISQIKELHCAGASRKEIAAKTGRAYTTVNKWIRALEEGK